MFASRSTTSGGATTLTSSCSITSSRGTDDSEEETRRKRFPADKAYYIAKELLMTERTYKKDLEVITVVSDSKFILVSSCSHTSTSLSSQQQLQTYCNCNITILVFPMYHFSGNMCSLYQEKEHSSLMGCLTTMPQSVLLIAHTINIRLFKAQGVPSISHINSLLSIQGLFRMVYQPVFSDHCIHLSYNCLLFFNKIFFVYYSGSVTW